MNRLIRTALLFLLTLVLLFPAVLPASADEEEEELKYMAYNFYSNPDLSKTSGKFESFMIDLKADKTPLATYWSLCNFGMDLTSSGTRKAYRNISGYGAYAGLQNSNAKVGILSFWEARYKENGKDTILNAERIYPSGSSSFGGEGDGVNCIMGYNWETGGWYRMLLHSWEDYETGTTFAGVWFLDVQSGQWRLFSYFNTRLYDSFFIGDMSQFMENFSGGDVKNNCNVERTCNLKNMYVFDHEKKEWISLPTSTLSYGDGGPKTEDQKKYGAHSFGAEEDYFWGSTGGKVEDQAAYERAAVKWQTYTIKQPDQPSFGAPAVKSLTLTASNKLIWRFEDASTPQLAYELKVVDASGATVYEAYETRPHVNSVKLGVSSDDAVKCTLTVTDVFGTKTTAEYKSDAYKAATGEVDDPADPVDPTPEPSDPGIKKATVPPAVYIAAGVGGALVIAGAVAAAVIIGKKKKK